MKWVKGDLVKVSYDGWSHSLFSHWRFQVVEVLEKSLGCERMIAGKVSPIYYFPKSVCQKISLQESEYANVSGSKP